MIDGLSDGPQAQEEEREAKVRADEAHADACGVLGTVGGRRFMYVVLAQMGAFDAVYTGRQAGRHEASIEIIIRIKAAGLHYWHAMLQENEK